MSEPQIPPPDASEDERREFGRQMAIDSLLNLALGTKIVAEKKSSRQIPAAQPVSARKSASRLSSVRRRPASGRRRRQTAALSWALPLLAASVALVIGIFAWQKQEQPAVSAIASLSSISGSVNIERAQKTMVATAHSELQDGDRVILSGDAAATVAYADGTRISLSHGATAVLKSAGGAKRMDMRNGELAASVAKQPAGKPFVFATPFARATVVGTELMIAVKSDSTRLDVTEGKVRLTLPDDTQGVDVSAGRTAVASAGGVPALLAVVVAVAKPAERKPFSRSAGRPFSDSSPWNVPIPENPVLDSNSAAIVGNISQQANASLFRFAVPIYDADENTPTHKITTTPSRGQTPFLNKDVRIPSGAKTNSGPNASFVVLDWHARRTWEFYKFAWKGQDVQCVGGGSISLDENGVDMLGSGTAGASMIAGLIRVREIEEGVIDHAVSIATKFTKPAEFRYPAHGTDGNYSGVGAISAGTRVQLDPSIDLAAIPGITRAELAIGRALQKYGGYCVGRTTTPLLFNFELAPDATGMANPGKIYVEAGLPNASTELTHVPWNKLRVLKKWDGKGD